MFKSKLCVLTYCSFHDRRLNSTQGEIRVGPSHQVKQILVAYLLGFHFFFFCWPFILLSSNLELLLQYRKFYINAEILFQITNKKL